MMAAATTSPAHLERKDNLMRNRELFGAVARLCAAMVVAVAPVTAAQGQVDPAAWDCDSETCVQREATLLGTLEGYADHGANLSTSSEAGRVAALRAQKYRRFTFDIPARMEIHAEAYKDESYMPADWPADIGLADKGVSVELWGRQGGGDWQRMEPWGELPAASQVEVLVIQPSGGTSAYITHFPVHWFVDVHYRLVRDAGSAVHDAPTLVAPQPTGDALAQFTIAGAGPIGVDDGCGQGALECAAPPDPVDVAPDDSVLLADPGDDPACGEDLECRPEPVDQPDIVAPLDIEPTGTMECAGAECVEPDIEPVPLEDAAGAAPAQDRALDLAFWQSIEGSDDPGLYRAYLDQFPNGTFRAIAEARLAGLQDQPQPPPVAADDPAALHAQAMARLDTVYARPTAEWDAAAREPVALLRRAAAAGHGPALMQLGLLAEQGIGLPADPNEAIRLYVQAGDAGTTAAYFQALMVLDAIGDNTGFVTLFERAYRVSPAMAYETLTRDVSKQASVWLQQALRAERYYDGAIDGAFGPASQAAFDAYMAGSPAPVAPAAPTADDDALARALQRELARVGCYAGEIDGKWGPASAQALTAFNGWMAGPGPVDRPTEAALANVRAATGLVCGVD